MLDKQEHNLRQEALPLNGQDCQTNKTFTRKRRRQQDQQGRSSTLQKKEPKEAGTWSESVLMQSFTFIIEKLDGKKKVSKRARRNVVEEEEKYCMGLAEVFAKRLERARQGKFTFLLVGRADAGRANPMNVLLGEDIVPGDVHHETLQVITYEHKIAENKFSIIDTPGLCDAPTDHVKDYVYVTRLEDGAPRFDGLWFVTPLLEADITDGEKRAIKLITRAYGSDAWRYSLIVFTHDEILEQGMAYQKIYQEKMECIRQEIARLTGEEIAAEIPAVAVASTPQKASDSKEWLSQLYVTVSTRMSDQGYLSFLLTTARRLKFLPLQSSRKSTQSIRINACPVNQPSASSRDQEEYICIDEEKGREIEQRMRNYLMNVAKRNSISFS